MLHISQWLHTYMIARVSDGKKKIKNRVASDPGVLLFQERTFRLS